MHSHIVAEISSVNVHGLSRVISAKNPIIRLVWTALLTCATVAFSYHLYLLERRFSDAPVSTKVSLQHVKFRFPSFYICSRFLFSYSNYDESFRNGKFARLHALNNRTMFALNSIYRMYLNDKRSKNVTEFKISTLKISGQFETYTWDEMFGVYDKYQTIIKASINNEEMDMDVFQMVQHEEYYTCFRFVNKSRLTSPSDILTLYLYNDVTQLWRNVRLSKIIASVQYSGELVDDKSSGMVLLFTEDGYYPGSSAERLIVSSGMHTEVSISMKELSMMNTVRDRCRQQPRSVDVISHLDTTSIISYKLDQAFCDRYEWAMEFHRHCGCVPLAYPIPACFFHLTNRCLNVSHWTQEKVLENIFCVDRVKKEKSVKDSVKQKCAGIDSCKKIQYDLRWSGSSWPTSQLISSFVTKVMLPVYKRRVANNHSVPAWRNVIASNQQNQPLMVRENVLKVEISPKEARSTRVEESEAYPAMSFFSDIGGILGLYLGMSILSVCELLQSLMLITDVVSWIKKRTSKVGNMQTASSE